MKASEWIDRVKAAKGLPSDYAVAKVTGLSRQSVSDYRHKGTVMDDESSMKVAKFLEIDPGIVLADQARERSKNDLVRATWSEIIQKLGGVAASVMLMAGLGGVLGWSPDAQAVGRYGNNSNSELPGYTLCKTRRRQRKAADPMAAMAAYLTGLSRKLG